LPHPSSAIIRIPLSEADAAKAGLTGEWRAAMERRERRRSRERARANELRGILQSLAERSQANNWSGRTLAAKLGLAERTLRRIRSGQADPRRWLPALREANGILQAKGP
jgi:ribosome-binding protein aMBF1 (putative translation factor)